MDKIEQLKAKIKATKDPIKKAALMKELSALRETKKEEGAQEMFDGMKEGRAKKAEKSGDKGRAIRIRSAKQLQGVGEEGRESYSTEDGKIASKKKVYRKGGIIIRKKKC